MPGITPRLWGNGRDRGWQGEHKQKPGTGQDQELLSSPLHLGAPPQVTQKPQILPVAPKSGETLKQEEAQNKSFADLGV